MNHPEAPLHLSDPMSADNPSWSAFDELQGKHPSSKPASEEALLLPFLSTTSFHPVAFDALDGEAIRSAALCTRGAAGLLGVNVFACEDYVFPFVRPLLIFYLALPWLPGIYVQKWVIPVVSMLLWHVISFSLTNALKFDPLPHWDW